MSERVELQLPPEQYCRRECPEGYTYVLELESTDGNPAITVFLYGEKVDRIYEPWIVYSVGAIAWGREVERLRAEWLKIPAPRTQLANKLMFAQDQEAAWRAAESEDDDG